MAITRTPIATYNSKNFSGGSPGGAWFSSGSAGTLSVLIVACDVAITSVTGSFINGDGSVTLDSDISVNNSGNVFVGIYSHYNLLDWTTSGLSFTVSGGPYSVAFVTLNISGLTSSPKDKSNTGQGSSATAASGTTGTLSQAVEIIICGAGWEGPLSDDTNNWDGTSGLNAGQEDGTTGSGDASNIKMDEGYKIVSVNTAINPTDTNNTSSKRDWACAIVTYKGSTSTPLSDSVSDSQAANWNDAQARIKGYAIPKSDSNTLADAIDRFSAWKILKGDTLIWADEILKIFRHFIIQQDAFLISDVDIISRAGVNGYAADSFTLSDTQSTFLTYKLNLIETLILDDAQLRFLAHFKSFEDSYTLNEFFEFNLQEFLADITRTFSDSILFLDDIINWFTYNSSYVDGYTLTDICIYRANLLSNFSDSYTLNDSTSRLLRLLNLQSDALSFQDLLGRFLTYKLTPSDILTLQDLLSTGGQLNSIFADSYTLNDSLSRLAAQFRSYVDSYTITDNLTFFQAYFRLLTEDLNTLQDFIETFLQSISGEITLNLGDTLTSFLDSINRFSVGYLTRQDTLTLDDSTNKLLSYLKLTSDAYTLQDAIAQLQGLLINPSDGLDLQDGTSKAAGYRRALSDLLTLLDSIVTTATQGANLAISLSDSINNYHEFMQAVYKGRISIDTSNIGYLRRYLNDVI